MNRRNDNNVKKLATYKRKAQEEERGTFQISSLQENGIRVGGKLIEYRNPAQFKCAQMIDANTVTFIHGPIGTSKTFIPVAYLCAALEEKKIDKIVLSRNTIEDTEDDGMGFLKGSMREKLEPYIAPMIEALDKSLGKEKRVRYEEAGKIVFASLRHIRGTNFERAGVFVDESQNNYPGQNRTLLTRFHKDCKIIMSGDVNQMDIDEEYRDNYYKMAKKLSNHERVGLFEYTKADNCRDELTNAIADDLDTLETERKEALQQSGKTGGAVVAFKHG